MDIDDEVVETSDIEELEEELQDRARKARKSLDNDEHEHSTERGICRPPRKRAKYFHEIANSPTQDLRSLSISPTKYTSADTTSPLRYSSSSTALNFTSPSSRSALSRSPSQTPVGSPYEQSKDDEEQYNTTDTTRSSHSQSISQDPRLLSSQSHGLISAQESRAGLVPLGGDDEVMALSPVFEAHNVSAHLSTTPTNSPPKPWHLLVDSPSVPRLIPNRIQSPLLTSCLESSISIGDIEPAKEVDSDDELLIFTPVKRPSSRSDTSSLNPTSPGSPSQILVKGTPKLDSGESDNISESHPHRSPHLSLSSGPPQSSGQPTVDDDHSLAVSLEEESRGSRYPLRKRNLAQLNPYTTENWRYKQALKSNPEAIVKFKGLERRHRHGPDDHYEEEGETQQDVYIDDGVEDEDAGWEDYEARRQRREEKRRQDQDTNPTSVHQDVTNYSNILPDLSDSDNEEQRALSKEAKKAAKEMERKKKLLEKEERQRLREEYARHRKRFPMSIHKKIPFESSDIGERVSQIHANDDGDEMNMDQRSSGVLSPTDVMIQDQYFAEGDDLYLEMHHTPVPDAEASISRGSSRPPFTVPDQSLGYQNDFPEGSIFENSEQHDTFPQDDLSFSATLSDVDRIHFPESPQHDGLDPESPGSSQHSSDIEIVLKPQQKRWAKRVLPRSLFKELAKKDTMVVSSRKRKNRTPQPVDSENDGPLLPGQTRVQKSAKPKEVRAIKGDSESELEVTSDSGASTSNERGAEYRSFKHENDPDSDVVEILESYRPPSPSIKQGSLAVNFQEDDYSSEDTFDDEDIQDHFLARQNEEVNYSRETSLIDFMLTRSRNIGGSRKQRKPSGSTHRKRRGSSPLSKYKYKLDITTRGARGYGHTKQSLLSFHVDVQSKKRSRPSNLATTSAVASPKRVRTSRRIPAREHSFSNNESDPLYEDSEQFLEGETEHYSARNQRYYHPHSRPKAGPSRTQAPKNSAIQKTHVMHTGSDHEPNDSDHLEVANQERYPRRLSRKEKEKARRKQARMNGVWCNPSDGQTITNGIPRAYVTIDVEDEGFNLAVAPKPTTKAQRDHWSERFRPLSPQPKFDRKSRPESDKNPEVRPRNIQNNRGLPSDMLIPFLKVGKSFGKSSYIGKGWLYELINAVSTAQDPVLPPSITLLGFSLEPNMGVSEFCLIMPDISSALFEFATGLPDPDHETLKAQWSIVTHCVSRLVSWYMKNSVEGEIITLRETIEKAVFRLVAQVESFNFKFIDAPILSLCWFAVEISARIELYQSTSNKTSRLVRTTSTLLMNFLLQFKLQKTMKPIQEDIELGALSTEHYTAELWTCLIHLLCTIKPKEGVDKTNHLFWSILLEVSKSRALKDHLIRPLDASEDAWFTIFSLCCLSQFSVHGMVAGQPRLPACWSAVIFALQKIGLSVSPTDSNDDEGRARDKYAAMLILRCMTLREKWHWKFDGSVVMFNKLLDIFRVRKFANLFHETHKLCDVPEYMRLGNWDLLSKYDVKDTAFAVLLKLIVQFAQEDPSQFKKLQSMILPTGSVLLSEKSSDHDLSMLYNRLAAASVALYLDPKSYRELILKARSYLEFGDANPTMRFNLIRVMSRWAILLISSGIDLDAMSGWFAEIAKVLETESKNFGLGQSSSQSDEVQKKNNLFFISNALLSAIRHIFEAHTKTGRYPEPSLIEALNPLLTSWIGRDNAIKLEFYRLGNAIFTARSASLPPLGRPSLHVPVVDEESQESQDFGIDDFANLNFDNLEALADPVKKKEDALWHVLETTTRFKWRIRPFLSPYFEAPPPHISRQAHRGECDKWIRLWLCCSAVDPQADKWSKSLALLDKMVAKDATNVHWTRSVQLSIMYQLLKLDPLAYLSTSDRAIQVFLFALVSETVTLEKEYVALVLSIVGLQHPLLQGAACLPDRNGISGDYEFSPAQFLELRLALLKVVFHNLNAMVRKELEGNLDVALDKKKYTDLLLEMFSEMRSTLSNHVQGDQKLAAYKAFCHDVIVTLRENLELRMDKRFDFWIDWGRGLTDDRENGA